MGLGKKIWLLSKAEPIKSKNKTQLNKVLEKRYMQTLFGEYNPNYWWEKTPVPYYPTYPTYIVKEEDEKKEGQLAKDYCRYCLSEDEKFAVKMGAMEEHGLLTFEGKELLIELFNEDKRVQTVFYEALRKLRKEEHGK